MQQNLFGHTREKLTLHLAGKLLTMLARFNSLFPLWALLLSVAAYFGLIHRVGHLGYVSAKRKVIY